MNPSLYHNFLESHKSEQALDLPRRAGFSQGTRPNPKRSGRSHRRRSEPDPHVQGAREGDRCPSPCRRGGPGRTLDTTRRWPWPNNKRLHVSRSKQAVTVNDAISTGGAAGKIWQAPLIMSHVRKTITCRTAGARNACTRPAGFRLLLMRGVGSRLPSRGVWTLKSNQHLIMNGNILLNCWSLVRPEKSTAIDLGAQSWTRMSVSCIGLFRPCYLM